MNHLWSKALSLVVVIAATVAGCTPTPVLPSDLDGLGVSDPRFNTANPELFVVSTLPEEATLTGTITAWSSGVEFELDGRTLALHGIREGSCPEFGQQLMSAWTHGREARAAVMDDGTAWLWVETADDRWQFANPWAVRFGVGSATRAEGPHMGLLSDESAAPKPKFRPKTWECLQ